MLSLLYLVTFIHAVRSAAVADLHTIEEIQQPLRQHIPAERGHNGVMIPGTALAVLQGDYSEDSVQIERLDLDWRETEDLLYGKLSLKGEVLEDIGSTPMLYYTLYQNGTKTFQRQLPLHHSLSQAPSIPGGIELKQSYTKMEEALHQGSFELKLWDLATESMVLPGWYTVRVEMRDSLDRRMTHFKLTRWTNGWQLPYAGAVHGVDEEEDDARKI